MKTAGVCIDPWKLEIFKKHLDEAGYQYKEFPGEEMTVLQVKYEWVHKLQPIIEAANAECARSRGNA
jgi:hypothetical protein